MEYIDNVDMKKKTHLSEFTREVMNLLQIIYHKIAKNVYNKRNIFFSKIESYSNLEFYTFFSSGDLLDAPKWHKRTKKGTVTGSQHDSTHFDIAIELANYIVENNK